MKKLVGAIKRIFANEVEIHLSREQVLVAWDGQTRILCPVVHVAIGPGPPRIIGIGDEFGRVESSVAIPIFGPLPPAVTIETWAEGLDSFMAYALLLARGRLVAVRPIVRLRGVAAVGPLPSGNPDLILTSAVLRAGAFHCTVEDT